MRPANFTILVVEDDPDDQDLITLAFRQNGVTQGIQCLDGGQEAISYLKGDGKYSDRSRFPYPTFIMTDLKMSIGDGMSVLEHLKSVPEWAIIPTVAFSGSEDPDDIKKSYMLGASSYIVKPADFTEMRRVLKVLYDYWLECRVPQVDLTGRRVETDSRGKMGERFRQTG